MGELSGAQRGEAAALARLLDELAGAVSDLALVVAALPGPVHMERLAAIRDRVAVVQEAARAMDVGSEEDGRA